jgi:hypothetical protein
MSSKGKANAALAAAVIFLLLSSCAPYLASTRLKSSEGWVRHTHDVQSALAQFAITWIVPICALVLVVGGGARKTNPRPIRSSKSRLGMPAISRWRWA